VLWSVLDAVVAGGDALSVAGDVRGDEYAGQQWFLPESM
jgi:hypothetical protein